MLIVVALAILILVVGLSELSREVREPALIVVARERAMSIPPMVSEEEGEAEEQEGEFFDNLPGEQWGEWERIFGADSILNRTRLRRFLVRLLEAFER